MGEGTKLPGWRAEGTRCRVEGAGLFIVGAAGLIALLAAVSAGAQDLEPRAYSPSPVGTTFLVVSATRSTGGVFTDPSVPITDASAKLGILTVGFGRTFGWWGRQVQVLGGAPIAWGKASGRIGEDRRVAYRRGLGDPRIRVSAILFGPPAQTPAEFARSRRQTIVGASLTVAPPLGQYDSTKLVNLGAHRWSFKPEIGLSYPAGRWTLDGYAGVWLFSDNSVYYPGTSHRSQDRIVSLQGHATYTLMRRGWLAGSVTWYEGGRSTVDGVRKADLLKNTRVGATLALPVDRRQSVKVNYSAGAATRIGSDFRTISLAWQMVLF